jgi:hypothetical protein
VVTSYPARFTTPSMKSVGVPRAPRDSPANAPPNSLEHADALAQSFLDLFDGTERLAPVWALVVAQGHHDSPSPVTSSPTSY